MKYISEPHYCLQVIGIFVNGGDDGFCFFQIQALLLSKLSVILALKPFFWYFHAFSTQPYSSYSNRFHRYQVIIL